MKRSWEEPTLESMTSFPRKSWTNARSCYRSTKGSYKAPMLSSRLISCMSMGGFIMTKTPHHSCNQSLDTHQDYPYDQRIEGTVHCARDGVAGAPPWGQGCPGAGVWWPGIEPWGPAQRGDMGLSSYRPTSCTLSCGVQVQCVGRLPGAEALAGRSMATKTSNWHLECHLSVGEGPGVGMWGW